MSEELPLHNGQPVSPENNQHLDYAKELWAKNSAHDTDWQPPHRWHGVSTVKANGGHNTLDFFVQKSADGKEGRSFIVNDAEKAVSGEAATARYDLKTGAVEVNDPRGIVGKTQDAQYTVEDMAKGAAEEVAREAGKSSRHQDAVRQSRSASGTQHSR